MARQGIFAAALAALVLMGAQASAQVPDPFARQLAQRLAYLESHLSEDGYSRAAGPFAGALGGEDSRRVTVTLRAGQEYRVVGVCETRCTEMELRLFDGRERLVALDRAGRDTPSVDVRPVVTGPHTIEVSVPSCPAAQPCYYAFNVYSR